MKKILFAAFAATLLAAGCQKTEIIAPSSNGPAITFSTEMKKITKAGEVTGPKADALGKDDNLHAQGFSIWAYADYDIRNATNVNKTSGPSYLIFDGMKDWFIEYVEADATNGTSAKWDSHKEFYWPGTGKNLRFFAVSAARVNSNNNEELSTLKYAVTIDHRINPDSHIQTVNDGTSDDLENEEPQPAVTYPSMTIANFEVTDGNEDLMVADFIRQNQDQNRKTVSLDFHHALSKVQFVFTTNTTETDEAKQPKVYVQKIELTGLKYKGNLTVTSTLETQSSATEAEVDAVAFNWDPTIDTTPFSATSEEDQISGTIEQLTGNTLSPKGLKLTPNANEGQKFATWLMLPQNIKGKQVEITYVINARQFKAIFPLDKNIESWACNQYIRYKVNLSPNLITFSASSTDWDNATDVNHQN